MPILPHQYLTAEEVADLLRVPVGTVYAWRHKHKGPPASRVGRHLRYDREAVIRWLKEQEDES